MLENIKILQVNLNKSLHATESTLQLAVELKVDIIAVQEPWIAPLSNNNYSAARSVAHQAFTQLLPLADNSLRPRVLFYISRTAKAETSLLEGLAADPDAIAVVVKGQSFKFNIVNVYNEKGPLGTKTFPRVLLSTRLPAATILAIDANEHHPWWDPLCPTTSQGAQELADWIEDQNLSLLNTPGAGTFFRPHLSREPVLDLSLATPDIANKVKDWQVTTETGSDHYGLLFSIQTTTELVDNPAAQQKYNTKRAN